MRCAIAAAALLSSFVTVTAYAEGGSIRGRVRGPARHLAETVVYVEKAPGPFAPKTVEMDQHNLAFVPHVLAISVGDTVRFLNHDHVQHNVFSPEGGYNLGAWGYDQSRSYTFKKTGTFTQLCSFHPEMLAYIFVGQNPYSAVVNDRGDYTIRGVPAGHYTVAVWNSHNKASPHEVTVEAGKTTHLDFTLSR